MAKNGLIKKLGMFAIGVAMLTQVGELPLA